jgi:tRNA nucleotidyltransferase (CCA-adding enzyme)
MANARLLPRFYRRLPADLAHAVRCAVNLAEERDAALYLAGGGVRDLLLGARHIDIDLVMEGDAIGLARAVSERLDARVVAHERFSTAAVRGDGFRLDFARAREERYARPGALPSVRPASIEDDLARRDFTVNAMALRLDGPEAGRVLDPFGGRDDLRRRRIRVLRQDSFRDDATRILRAVRYAGRLDFRIEPGTARLLQRDVSYFGTISGARLRRELELVVQEERVATIVRPAAKLGVLRAVHPALRPDDRALRAITRLPRVPESDRSAVLFALLLAAATPSKAEAATARLSLTRQQSLAVRDVIALRRKRKRLARESLSASAAARLFDAHSPAAVEAFALLEDSLAVRRARRYLDRWRGAKTLLNGEDVVELGVSRGPRVGEALTFLRDARLDGEVKTRRDETALLRRFFVREPVRSRRSRA